MGDLEELSKSYPDDEFMLVGACYDIYDSDGEVDQGQLEKAQTLMKEAGTSFSHIIPTKEMSALFKGTIPGFPTTFFVDENGKIIEYTCGAKDLETWKEAVDKVLETID